VEAMGLLWGLETGINLGISKLFFCGNYLLIIEAIRRERRMSCHTTTIIRDA